MISDGACRHAASARSSGFVLVGVVWFLAIMTLLASAAVLWVGRSLDATENRRKALLRELEEHALLARVQWLVATQRYTVAGLSVPGNAGAAPSKVDMDTSILPIGGELPLDGREFCMANGWCIALLDRSARLSLSGIDPRVLSRLLAGLGVPAEQVQVMVAQWFSYLYPGAAPRLGSAAQASDRSSPGQARRRPLRSVMEVFRLEAWRPWEAHLLDAGWRDLVAADEAALNINTADARILSLAWGLPEDAVGRLLQARWQRPFTRMSDLHDPISPPGFLPPRLWQGRGKDGRAQLEWVRRGTGLARRAPAQWIVDRAWCVYRCLDLNHVPRSDRYQALALKLAALAPFRRAGHYVAWRGGHALVWFWDEEVREAVAEDCVDQPRRYRCIPESLLQAPPRSVAEGETVRLLRVRSGLDLQVWRDDCLVLSHFFPSPPQPEQWVRLLRGLAGIRIPESLVAEPGESLGRPWAVPAAEATLLRWERWLPHGLIATLLLGCGFNLGEGLSWWWAERALRTQYDQLSDQVSPILSARNQALQTNRMATELGRALQHRSQVALLGQVAELLPKDSRLLAWRYRGSELDLRIGTDSVDPRLYVRRFMESGSFEDVRVEPSQSEGLSLSLVLRTPGEGA